MDHGISGNIINCNVILDMTPIISSTQMLRMCTIMGSSYWLPILQVPYQYKDPVFQSNLMMEIRQSYHCLITQFPIFENKKHVYIEIVALSCLYLIYLLFTLDWSVWLPSPTRPNYDWLGSGGRTHTPAKKTGTQERLGLHTGNNFRIQPWQQCPEIRMVTINSLTPGKFE